MYKRQVAKLRGICGTRRIGHGGTLDPMATGVLPDVYKRQGVKELIVVAQDITACGADRGRVEIAELLDALNAVEGIEWIRLLYAYPCLLYTSRCV